MSEEKILCVDDDPNILQAYKRALRKSFAIETALGPDEALKLVGEERYAVVVADMRMPGMNGVELLARVKQLSPGTVRMMLTGNSDQETALRAVNEGEIFRFMTKPCPPEVLAQVLQAGLEQHRLLHLEKDLLSRTLSGSVKMLTELLATVNPAAFGRVTRLRELVHNLCTELHVEVAWPVEVAAMVALIGCVAVPQRLLERMLAGEDLEGEDLETYCRHARVGSELLENIPRMERVAEIVRYQEKQFDGGGFPADPRRGTDIPLGSRILKVALDWDLLASRDIAPETAMATMIDRKSVYDPNVLAALCRALAIRQIHRIEVVGIGELVDGMIFASHVRSISGTALFAKGQEVNQAVRLRLRNYAVNVGVAGPIRVFVPVGVDQ